MTPAERMRQWISEQPKKLCQDCGNRPREKKSTRCSECAYIQRQHKLEIYRHDYKIAHSEIIAKSIKRGNTRASIRRITRKMFEEAV